MKRMFNFGAGPAMLPLPVLQKVQEELLDWHGSGTSVMEMSHRGKHFTSILAEAKDDLRTLLVIPENYEILFLQGGATAQFAAVPLNLLGDKEKADYILTGYWSKKAIAEGKRFANVHIAASSESSGFTQAPLDWMLSDDAAYVHYTANETIHGVEFPEIPDVGDRTLVADMSSNMLSRPFDIKKFGLVYAGAQKNIGPAGLTLAIVRKDLAGKASAHTPTVLDYQAQIEADSCYNTPATFAIYVAGLVFKWLLQEGGLVAMEQKNIKKAQMLYDYIDNSSLYTNPVEKAFRSRMNVPFRLKNENLNDLFLNEAKEKGLIELKGHRAVGGMRASIYNAMPLEGVVALIDFMKEFANRHA